MGKIVLQTANLVDKHGDVFTVEAMRSALLSLNGERKARYGVNHRRDFPPLGYIVNGEIIEERGYVRLTGEPLFYTHRKELEWDSTLLMEYSDETYPFIEVESDFSEQMSVSLDPNTFPSFEVFESVALEIESIFQNGIETKDHVRKSEILTPELISTLYYKIFWGIIVYKIGGPIVKKIGENLKDKISGDISEVAYESAKNALKDYRYRLIRAFKLVAAKITKNNRKLTTVFEIPGEPHVELIAKTNDSKLIEKGLSETQLVKVGEKILSFSNRMEIAKIQFVLTPSGQWSFNYFLTKRGESVGKKTIFKERDRTLQRIQLKN